jgi:molecular chaperone HtpG
MSAPQTTKGEEMRFEAEVTRLLDIVTHALYSNRDVFLRELISNASDACDRLRYAALSEPTLLGEDSKLGVALTIDRQAKTLTVTDNGIGMGREELVHNLGTIARSGTANFAQELGDKKGDVALIGQFGVGFYSAFMVAHRVTVRSRHAAGTEAWAWQSTGQGRFSIEALEQAPRGTSIELELRPDALHYLEPAELERIISTYSQHLPVPITLQEDGKEPKAVGGGSALWMRSKDELSQSDYNAFYHLVAHAFDEPCSLYPEQAAFRPFRSGPQECREALCKARFYHRRCAGTYSLLAAVFTRRDRFRRPAAQRQPRAFAKKPGSRQNSQRADQESLG